MMLKEVIYDFDGTLSDTYPVFTEAFLRVLKLNGIEEDYDTAYAHLKVTVGHAFEQYPSLPKEAKQQFKDIHYELAMDHQFPMEGAEEILRYVVENGGNNYIFTHSSKNVVGPLLDKWGLSKYITDMVDGTYKIHRKPHPDGVNVLLEKHLIDPAEAIIVGDRDIDIISGQRAGIKGCLLDPEHFCDFFKDSEYEIQNLVELKNILCK